MKGLSARTVKRTLKGKSRVKQEYLINIQMIKGLESVENQEFYVEWKRGDKAENKGKFEKDIVKNGKLVFSPSLEIKLNCTLFVGKDGKYEEKPIAFSLHSTNKKSKDPVFKGKMNLAEFTDYTDEKPIELKLVGKKNSGILLLLIKSGYAGEGDSMDETEIMISEDVESQPKDVLDLLVSQQATNHSSKLSKEINDDNVIENNKDMINTEDIKKDDEIVNNDEMNILMILKKKKKMNN
ncbi:C2 NT-type domain-containing protein [Entamoeba marina]